MVSQETINSQHNPISNILFFKVAEINIEGKWKTVIFKHPNQMKHILKHCSMMLLAV